jgi:hypothetical protein
MDDLGIEFVDDDAATGRTAKDPVNIVAVQYTYILYIITPVKSINQKFFKAVDSIRTEESLFSKTGLTVPAFDFSEPKTRIASGELVDNYIYTLDEIARKLYGSIPLSYLYYKNLFSDCVESYVEFIITVFPDMSELDMLRAVSYYLTKFSGDLVLFREL